MKLKDFLLRQLTQFFVLTTFITAAILILGMLLDPDAKLEYSAMASPFLFAALGILPGTIMYSKRELSVRAVICRKVIQLILIEAEVLTVAYISPTIQTGKSGTVIALALSVLIIFAAANVISYLTDLHAAKELTQELNAFQKRGAEQ